MRVDRTTAPIAAEKVTLGIAVPHHRFRGVLRRGVHGELGAAPVAAGLEVDDPRRQLPLLWVVGLAVRAFARRLRGAQPGRGRRRRPAGLGAAPALGHDRDRCSRSGSARVVQVLRVLRRERAQRAARAGGAVTVPDPAGGLAGGHLLLHVHGDQLRRRRLPRQDRGGGLAGRGRLPVVLPPLGGRAHRAGFGAPAPTAGPPRSSAHRRLAGRVADHGRAGQEGRHLLVPGQPHRRPRVRTPPPALGPRGAVRHIRLRHPDLRRLQRVHRHRHRDRAAARVQVPGQLQLPVRRRVDAGLLAQVAHDTVVVVAGLPVHPPGRQPRPDVAHRRQHLLDDADRRAVARGRVDVRGVGRVSRHRPGNGAAAAEGP